MKNGKIKEKKDENEEIREVWIALGENYLSTNIYWIDLKNSDKYKILDFAWAIKRPLKHSGKHSLLDNLDNRPTLLFLEISQASKTWLQEMTVNNIEPKDNNKLICVLKTCNHQEFSKPFLSDLLSCLLIIIVVFL